MVRASASAPSRSHLGPGYEGVHRGQQMARNTSRATAFPLGHGATAGAALHYAVEQLLGPHCTVRRRSLASPGSPSLMTLKAVLNFVRRLWSGLFARGQARPVDWAQTRAPLTDDDRVMLSPAHA